MNEEQLESASLTGVKMAALVAGQSAEFQAAALRATVQFLDVEIENNRVEALTPMADEEKKRWGI